MLGMFGIGPTEILIAAAVVVVLMAIQGWLRPPEKR
jgi:Sec-independent protein translocase protein TatA